MNIPKVTRKAKKALSNFTNKYANEELLMSAAFLAGLLDETIDAVFIAAMDEGFLTRSRIKKLYEIQKMAKVIAEADMAPLLGGDS
jgi:hypothetical protein